MRVGRHIREILKVLAKQHCDMVRLKGFLPEETQVSASIYISRAVSYGFVKGIKYSSTRYIYYITARGHEALESPIVKEEKRQPAKPKHYVRVASVWDLGKD